MTVAFDTFMAQYRMTGSEKADGYTRGAFDGLAESEKDIVFSTLESELPFSVEWLFYLDPERAREVVKRAEQESRGDAYQHTYLLQEFLVRSAGELQYQVHLLEDYPHYADRLKPLVINAVGRTPANEKTIGFFKRVILTETNMSAIRRAAQELFWAMKLSADTEPDEQSDGRLLDDLANENVDIRAKAVARVG